MVARFGDACDGATLNILLPELCISVEGLVVDLIDRASLAEQRRRGDAGWRAEAAASLIAARWIEPSPAQREQGGLLGTLQLRLEQPVLFHLVAGDRHGGHLMPQVIVEVPDPYSASTISAVHSSSL